MTERWLTGTWLGKRWQSDEHYVSLEDGKIVRARTVRPATGDCAWNRNIFDEIQGGPSDPAGLWKRDERPLGVQAEVPRIPADRELPVEEPMPRREGAAVAEHL